MVQIIISSKDILIPITLGIALYNLYFIQNPEGVAYHAISGHIFYSLGSICGFISLIIKLPYIIYCAYPDKWEQIWPLFMSAWGSTLIISLSFFTIGFVLNNIF